jgi:lantibiotic modifying enzyme
MPDYLDAACQAANFIDNQRLETPGQWRRAIGSDRRDRSLYHGSAGILLLLLELHAATGKAERLDQAIAAGDEIAAYLAKTDWLSVSVATGWPGYAFALGELGRVSGRQDFLALAASCLDRLRTQATEFERGIGWIEPMPFSDITGFTGNREIYDQSVGAAGAALVMLSAHRSGLHDQALGWAVAVGDRLLDVAETDPDGLRWRLMSDMPFPFTTPNFAHGGAGVGYLMAELYRATGAIRFLDAAREAARYVLSRSAPVGSGCLVCRTEEAADPIYYLGQCHGPAGTARLFLALHEISGDPVWLDHAKALMRGLDAMGAPEARSTGLWNNYGQCCGDAGIGEFALLMASRTGDAHYLELAKRCADVILAASITGDNQRHWRQAEHRDRPDFVEAQTGYMQGAAGIASFLLHLATTISGNPIKLALPDWPEMKA